MLPNTNPMERALGFNWILLSLYKQYGANVFKKMSEQSWLSTRYAYLHNHLINRSINKPLKDTSLPWFVGMWVRYLVTCRRRYLASIWDNNIEKLRYSITMGCQHERCPKTDEILALKDKFFENGPGLLWEDLSKEEVCMIGRWGHELKLCGG